MQWCGKRVMRVRHRRGSRRAAGGRGVKVWKVGMGDGEQDVQFFSSYEVLTWTVGGILWFIQQELLHLYKLDSAKV